MSNEFKDEMLQLLTQVDDVKATEAALHTDESYIRTKLLNLSGLEAH
jgi:hypothetical protein